MAETGEACLKDHDIEADPGARILSYANDSKPKMIRERIYVDPESYSYQQFGPVDVVVPECP
ncbi:hypothetical protein QTH97_22170 [Variovorax sp. J22R24]|uniref:hypothetical protein n=1 Tax=Variovorax gracilis TaxID=3053502 RepID=UPI002576C226|nr:hypothetical protein [Variovorax sp. J22R24]MDM0107671.1 hypothetical protein [Variovorax sp. J22R24]